MRPEASKRSTLHLQMGQETVYLVLTMAVFATVVLSAMLYKTRQPFEDPPIITLAEADGFYFAPGSPAISQDFDRQLRATVVPRLRTIADKYGAYTVEVIGNTDEVPLGPSLRRGSNLDGSLAAWLTERSVGNPIAYDNVGLGMARAVAVTRALRQAGLDNEFAIVPLSAGPFLRPDDTVADGSDKVDDQTRRRIEIRLRRRARR